jgi:hypothetical protein
MLGLSVVTNLLGGLGPTKQEQKDAEVKQKDEKNLRAENERELQERKREFNNEKGMSSPPEPEQKKQIV